MAFPLPRYRTGDAELDRQVADLVEATGAVRHRDLLFEILASGVRLARDGTNRLDLKITSAALREMRAAFRIFAPFEDVSKVTIFGSARTLPDDPLYQQTREIAAAMADEGWMVITGAGPGIMQAGMEGAGRERSIGVSIRLPFETGANEIIAGDQKLVSMKYFFTRKLMLMKESKGFISLPGGFGTLDEVFELLTLQQTGKADPAPIVLVDFPGDHYWKAWERWVRDHVASMGLISPSDLDLVFITDDVTAARDEIIGFWRNYHSIRWSAGRLIIRLRAEPTDAEMVALNEQFESLCTSGSIERSGPLPAEITDDDAVDLPRLVMRFDQWRVGSLHRIVRALNALESAPSLREETGGSLST